MMNIFRSDRSRPNPLEVRGADTLDFSIVVPFYSPGPRFGPHLANIIEVLEASGSTFEVIAVSDGSNDGSKRAISDLNHHCIRLIALAHGGKGSALRAGMTEARGRYVGFIDADGDLPAHLIMHFIELTRVDKAPDIVLGSKRHPDSEVVYPLLRRCYSLAYQALIGILFHLPVRDTQTGIKFVRREVLLAVAPRMVEKRFVFDLELLVVARHLGYRQFVEAPVQIGERFSSTISIRAVRGMLLDTLAIFYRLHILKYYDNTPGDTQQLSRSKPTGQQTPSKGSSSESLGFKEQAVEVPPPTHSSSSISSVTKPIK